MSQSAKTILSRLAGVNIQSLCRNSPTQTQGFLRAIEQNRNTSHLSFEIFKEAAPHSWEDTLSQVSHLRDTTSSCGSGTFERPSLQSHEREAGRFPPTAQCP